MIIFVNSLQNYANVVSTVPASEYMDKLCDGTTSLCLLMLNQFH